VKDKSLSTDAHNVKIIASDGKVTLKGPVESEEEKKAVENKATQVAGAENVTSEITVAASK
jgi:hyperosmotically inducible periplasmic protein